MIDLKRRNTEYNSIYITSIYGNDIFSEDYSLYNVDYRSVQENLHKFKRSTDLLSKNDPYFHIL